ncbi:hypothetical protein GOODEAATRI_027379 [Goodea atripinnis]|uniref:Uncharacterized protein n=1 Tax=Goodea atripinnis TaxID=208336 RepID=A0ABV0PS64_9TELE
MLQPGWIKHSPKSGVTGDMLVESGEDCLQIGVVEVTSNNKCSLRMFGLVFANGCIKFFHSQLSISIRGDIYCSEYNGSEISGEIIRSASDQYKLHISHVSVKIMASESIIHLLLVMESRISSILFAREQTLARKMLGRGNQCDFRAYTAFVCVLGAVCVHFRLAGKSEQPLVFLRYLGRVGDRQ